MKNGYGIIKDLTADGHEIFTSVEEAIEIIKKLYHESDVVLGEFFATIAINHCTIEEVITISARARKEIDGEDMYIVNLDDIGNKNVVLLKGLISIVGRPV